MRQILFRIPFDAHLPDALGGFPVFGAGVLLLAWCAWSVWRLVSHVRRHGYDGEFTSQVVTAVLIAAAIYKVPQFLPSVPVYGYGAMLLAGFFTGGMLAARRARSLGLSPDVIWDLAMWIFIPGILGARVFYIVQNRDVFFQDAEGRPLQGFENLMAIVNLPRGGLVLYGGVIASIVSYLVFCRRRKISPVMLADIVTPSIFIGEMFGRIGCFLNGCCYGDPCSLPWSVAFPKASVPFDAEMARGLIPPDALHSLWIHPTQLYSSLNALVLAVLTWTYFPYRRRSGEVLLIGWLCYPISRFLIEYLRGDELPIPFNLGEVLRVVSFGLMQVQTGDIPIAFTISQWVSIFMFAGALVFWYVLARRSAKVRTASAPAAAPAPSPQKLASTGAA
ncbi:MAG TPA: prolipoprotein diacylglyceryl transferase [Planctomycetaceae bacterium]|nr:prolipoprotein diacylglyceryl transferase [Planctomycetaceae bacterium]